MPVDNALYDQPGDRWWNEWQALAILRTLLNPARLDCLRAALSTRGMDPRGLAALDVGCGGGLLAEELARLGCAVTGVDPSAPSLAVARSHAEDGDLAIAYVEAPAEQLPFADGTFALVTCCDVLEHLADPAAALAEIARVLAPGGVFLYDTPNRTLLSWLVLIELAQRWPATRIAPRDLHDWRRFLRPAELRGLLARRGLAPCWETGLLPRSSPAAALRAIRACHHGSISYAELGRRLALHPSRLRAIAYMGWAVLSHRGAP
jgi:2-polyprenyl-6-hydroxyphenyl methylase/3-demethylubiquinone-9 3-methyltransferase